MGSLEREKQINLLQLVFAGFRDSAKQPKMPPQNVPPTRMTHLSMHATTYCTSDTVDRSDAKEGPQDPGVCCTASAEDDIRNVREMRLW